MPSRRRFCAAAAAGLVGPAVVGAAQRPVRIAFIDPLSGPSGAVGRNGLRSWRFVADWHNRRAPAGAPQFLVAGFDNKGSPQESLNALKVALDQGFRYIVQGNGSGVAAALSDALTRHNTRFPDRAALYVNYAAADPVLTGEKCSYWHFRIDADTTMKVSALATHMAEQPALRRIYLLNQNYAHGQQVSRHFKLAMALRRPDVQIVGDELHAPFQLTDFSRFAARIVESRAQAVVSGNWSSDMERLVEALSAARAELALYAYYPTLAGTPSALARAGAGLQVYQIAYNHGQHGGEVAALAEAFRQRHGEDFVIPACLTGVRLLAQGMARAGSTDPRRVAEALSGLRFLGFDGPVEMRAGDHQLQQDLYLSRWQRLAPGQGQGAEGTGMTFVPVRRFAAHEVATPVICQMARP